MENYTPDILEEQYARFLVRLDKCLKCECYMVTKPSYARDTFPYYYKLDFNAQVRNAGLVINSGIKVDGHPICEGCAKAGKADFLCALCKERKPTNKVQEKWGDNPEFLCSDCYETVPVKIWEEKSEELYDAHKYDFR